MSECILFLLDAARVATRSAASAFVERWADRDADKPSKAIAAFLVDLREEFPAGAGHRLWHEGEPDEPVTRPLLQLDLDLDGLDDARMRRLTAIAGRHRLQLFDPEGDVLYRADGSEESAAALLEKAQPPRIPMDEARSAEGLRFDGVYVTRLPTGTSFYRFTPEGEVYRLGDVNPDPKKAFLIMTPAEPLVAHGKYAFKGGKLVGRIRASFGSFKIEGEIRSEGLAVTSVRSDGNFRYEAMFHFEPVR